MTDQDFEAVKQARRKARKKLKRTVFVWYRQLDNDGKLSQHFDWLLLGKYLNDRTAMVAIKSHTKKMRKYGGIYRYMIKGGAWNGRSKN